MKEDKAHNRLSVELSVQRRNDKMQRMPVTPEVNDQLTMENVSFSQDGQGTSGSNRLTQPELTNWNNVVSEEQPIKM